VTKASGAVDVVCRTDENFSVSKSGGRNLEFKGKFKCPNQKPSEAEIKFDASTMSLPHDICHKDTIFYCKWNT